MVEVRSPERLADMIDDEEAFTLLDTRPQDDYEAWHVPGAENVPFGPEESLDDEQAARVRELNGQKPLATICAKGISSYEFAEELAAQGFADVAVVEGGMEAWSEVYETATIDFDAVEVIQLQRRAKGCLGYVVGSKATGEAAVIDATRHAAEFERAAEHAGYEITRVFDTHVHADHISGGRALADGLGVPYHLSERAAERGIDDEYEPLERNAVVEIGDVDIKAVAAPGHTTEMTAYLVGSEAVLTGDALFVDSIGRTELEFGEGGAAEGARMLYDTLHGTLMAEPDSVTVLPGHVTVEPDGTYANASPGAPIAASVGSLRRGLDVLGLDREAFVSRLTENVPEKPPNYETVIAINTGETQPEDDEEATELELGPNSCAAG